MFASILRDLGLIRVAEMAGEGARNQAKQGHVFTALQHCEYYKSISQLRTASLTFSLAIQIRRRILIRM